MKERVRELVTVGDKLFSKRPTQLWQEMAMNFCPMRADFTADLAADTEFASHLMTGRPTLAHRDLTNAISAMLRPQSKEWFHARTEDEAINEDATCRSW